MPDEHPVVVAPAHQARADFAAVADDLDFLKGSARADSDAEGAGTHGARDHLTCGGARDRVDAGVLARVALDKASHRGYHRQTRFTRPIL
jgi:hypothetical protein